MSKRPKHSAPSIEGLKNEFDEYKVFDDEFHIARLKVWYETFGAPKDMLYLGGIPAAIALHELRIAYVLGLNLSTIMTAHIFIEQVLGSSLIISGSTKKGESGLGAIIQTLIDSGDIEQHTAESLNELRMIRIAYFHSHEGLKTRGFMGRWLKSESSDPYELSDQDAYKAITAVADLIWENNQV